MKNIFVLFLLTAGLTFAQVKTPQPSPSAKINQTVGLTEVSVEYARPAMRGRTIMGGLVPHGELWRTGANKNSTIRFGDDVTIGGQPVSAGTYAIFTRPGKEMWEVFFYNKTDNWGTPAEWDAKKIAATVEAPVTEIEMPVESFTIAIENLSNNGAHLTLAWENTKVAVPFEVPTFEKAMASIKKQLKGSPKAGDYYSAASYYLDEKHDLPQAKKWIEKAISMEAEGKYWFHRRHALILAALNEKDAAIEAAKTSLELANKAGNQDYVRMNKKSIEEWGQ